MLTVQVSPPAEILSLPVKKLDWRSLGGPAYRLDSESMKERVYPREYRSCFGGSTHAHCAGRPASRDLAVACQ